MKTIDGIEGDILKKYSVGRVIDEEDEKYLEMMATTGLVKYGYDIEKEKPTAKTTKMGRMAIF